MCKKSCTFAAAKEFDNRNILRYEGSCKLSESSLLQLDEAEAPKKQRFYEESNCNYHVGGRDAAGDGS